MLLLDDASEAGEKVSAGVNDGVNFVVCQIVLSLITILLGKLSQDRTGLVVVFSVFDPSWHLVAWKFSGCFSGGPIRE